MSLTEPIDLRIAFPAYKIRKTEDHVPGCRIDPWNLEIPCRHGAIYPYGQGLLCAWAGPNKPVIRRKLLEMAGVSPLQVGDQEAVVTFEPTPELTEAVFALLGARRKRQISQDHLQRLQTGRRDAREISSSHSGEQL